MVWPFDLLASANKAKITKQFFFPKDLNLKKTKPVDFSFSFPIFQDWDIKKTEEIPNNPGQYRIFLNYPSNIDYEAPPCIMVNAINQGIKSEVEESLIRGPTENAKTSQNGVTYERVYEPQKGEWYEFYSDYSSASITFFGPSEGHGFSRKIFWEKIVSSFKFENKFKT